MNTSYKNMLRDRIPVYVDLALKWCKAKERWLNLVYDKQINIYVNKEDRYNATRIILGISNKNKLFDYKKSLDWDLLSKDDELILKPTIGWVDWFKHYLPYVDNIRKINLSMGKSSEDTISELYSIFVKTTNKDTALELAKFFVNNLKWIM